MKQEVIYKEICFQINGILFSVHNELGKYCNEKQYGDLIEKKLKEREINYGREKIIPQSFEGEKFGRNRVDFVIENKIILEIKCQRVVDRDVYYQARRYLKAFKMKLAIIVNFNENFLRPKRVLNSEIKEY